MVCVQVWQLKDMSDKDAWEKGKRGPDVSNIDSKKRRGGGLKSTFLLKVHGFFPIKPFRKFSMAELSYKIVCFVVIAMSCFNLTTQNAFRRPTVPRKHGAHARAKVE
jgi:hypothetical protein